MTNKYQWILKRATALLAALLMVLSVLPLAAAASADWTELQISGLVKKLPGSRYVRI